MKMVNIKNIALAMASLTISGAFAATPKLSSGTRIAAHPQQQDAVTTSSQFQRERPSARARKKNEKVRKNKLRRKRAAAEEEDLINASASSATSSSTIAPRAPGLGAGTSSTKLGKALKRPTFVDNIRASVLFEYYGSSITDPFSGYQVDRDNGYSQSNDREWLLTRATLGYAVTSNIKVAANAYFLTHGSTYVPETGGNAGDAKAFAFRGDFSFLQVAFGKFAQLGKVKWSGDFRAYPGIGFYGKGTPLLLRTGQNFFLPLSPRFTLAAYNTIRNLRHSSSTFDKADAKDTPSPRRIDYLVTLGPALEFQAADNLGLSLSYNKTIAHDHRRGGWYDGGTLGGVFMQPYFEFGVSWDVVKRVSFNPYVDLLTQTPNVDAMQVGANLNISIL